MEAVTSVLLILVGLINFVPVVAVGSAARVNAMYRIDVSSPELEILLRHRAVMFGIIGAFIIASAFIASLRWHAMTAAFLSMATFVALALSVGGYSDAIRRVVRVDVVGLGLLAAALLAQLG